MEYRILGPLAVEVAGRRLTLGGPRQRMVLALLLSRPNRTIPQDQLIEDVWDGDPPRTARSTLQGYVYALRQEMGDEAIIRRDEGYVVEADESSLDGLRFESLVRSGRGEVSNDPAAGAVMLQQALGLWYGLPFGDLGTSPPLVTEVSRLQELRLLAVESRVDAALVAGDHIGVVAELDSLVREYPLRERFWEQYMLALYRSNRQADALRTYQRARIVLAEELGIDPSNDLQQLEQKILEQDPELNSPSSSAPSPGVRSVRGYELREVISEGIAVTVYRAFQPSMSRELVVKAMRPEYANQDDFVREFGHESQRSAKLEHPHVIPIYDAWRDPSGAYLVMPMMRGGDLRSAIREGGLPSAEAVNLVDEVGGALAHAHRQGVVHGDVNVSKILLDEDRNAYLAGLGIAARFSGRAPSDLQAPERTRGDRPTVSSDVFGLGLVAHAVVSGVSGTDPVLPLPTVGNGRAGLAADIDRVLAKATHRDPSARYENIDEFLIDLRRSVSSNVIALNAPFRRESTDEPTRNPYKGLMAFEEADVGDFYGRDALIDEIVGTVGTANVVTVTGPSGSGKSSLVRAGVVPVLRSGGLPGSEAWLVTDMFPGSYPFEELESALLRVAVDRPVNLQEGLRQPHGLLRATKQVLGAGDHTLLLLIDQFEELFSAAIPEETRRQFIDELVAVAGDIRSRIRAVLTLRADFVSRALEYSDFAEVIGQGVVTVGMPTSEGLAHAIVEPAHGVGVDLEPGLMGRLVGDVQDQPGALPLFQYALTELFLSRAGDVLTIAGYEATGGVLGSLGRRSEGLFSNLSPGAQAAAAQLFLRLVAVDESGVVTRRRARQSELKSIGLDPGAVEEVIDLYGSSRLLSFDKDPVSRAPTVEVAHEALLNEWPRYREWIEARRDSVAFSRKIGIASLEWLDSDGDPSFLLRGARLEQALEWQNSDDIALTASETEYLEASDALETETASRERGRRRRVVGMLSTAVVVLAGLAIFALAQRRAAIEAADLAFAGELAAEANSAVETDPELTLLLALEAAEIFEAHVEPLSEGVMTAIRNGIRANRIEARLEGGSFIEVSPDGSQLVGGEGSDLFSWRIGPTDPVTVIPEGQISQADLGAWFEGPSGQYDRPDPDHRAMVENLSSFEPEEFLYSPDRTHLAAASMEVDVIGILDLEQETLWERDDLDQVHAMTWSSDGENLVVGGEGTLDVLDADRLDLVRRVPGPLSGTNWLVPVPGTSLVAASDHFGEEILLIDVGDAGEFELSGFTTPLEVWGITVAEDRLFASDLSSHLLADPSTGEVSVHRAGTYDSPEGDRGLGGMPTANKSLSFVAGPDMDGKSTIWSSQGEPVYSVPDGRHTTAINDDGTLAVIGRATGGPQLIRIPDGEVVSDLTTPGEVQRAWFSPDSRYVVVRANNPSVTRIWETTTGSLVSELVQPMSGLGWDFTPDGKHAVLGTPDGLVSILDFGLLVEGASPEEVEVRTIPAHSSIVVELDVSPDGSTIISSALDQPARLWDLETGELLSEFGTNARSRVAFHPTEPWLYDAEGRNISIHTLDTDELLEIARQRLTRDMTAEECTRYLGDLCEAGVS